MFWVKNSAACGACSCSRAVAFASPLSLDFANRSSSISMLQFAELTVLPTLCSTSEAISAIPRSVQNREPSSASQTDFEPCCQIHQPASRSRRSAKVQAGFHVVLPADTNGMIGQLLQGAGNSPAAGPRPSPAVSGSHQRCRIPLPRRRQRFPALSFLSERLPESADRACQTDHLQRCKHAAFPHPAAEQTSRRPWEQKPGLRRHPAGLRCRIAARSADRCGYDPQDRKFHRNSEIVPSGKVCSIGPSFFDVTIGLDANSNGPFFVGSRPACAYHRRC